MRRFVLVCLLLVLPLQWSWAAAARACLHESDPTVQHFGHHTHTHEVSSESAVAPEKAGDFAKSVLDNDCTTCHAMGASLVLATTAVPAYWDGNDLHSPYERTMADRPPDLLLRPPLHFLA